MKRSKIRLEEIIDIENCKKAILHASRRKRHRRQVRRILDNLDEYAKKLSRFLASPTAIYRDGHRSVINEGTHRKRREICKPVFFPDHCAHWAVMLIVGESFTKSLYRYSCASVKGRGTHFAKRAVERAVKDLKGTKYCLQIDIKSFYASIDKEILIRLLGRKFKDSRIVSIFAKIIRAYSGDGLPIGFYTSATLANYYLSRPDRYIKESLKVRHMVRYMDDMVMYDGNKRRLHAVREKYERFIGQTRRLRLKGNWQVYKMPYLRGKPPAGYKERRRATDFVGFRFYRYKTIIRKSIFLRLLRTVRRLQKGKYTKKNARAYISYNGYLKHTDSVGVRRRYITGKIKISRIKETARYEKRRIEPRGQSAAVA